jgi:hypothetical protein
MRLNSKGADVEQDGDFGVGLSLPHPRAGWIEELGVVAVDV